MTGAIQRYPRTRHVQGSRLQPGDSDLAAAPFSELRGKHLVVEEKVDGANCGISFDSDGTLRLQSRGHFLVGGPREKHFDLFKQWAHSVADVLWPVLGARYVLYGEWLYAKHTVFYDRLPAYLLEFDVLDRETKTFLATPRRRELLDGLPVHSVPVLHEGPVRSQKGLTGLIGPSAYISERHEDRLRAACARRGLDVDRVLRETDHSGVMEGLYIKVEEGGAVRERYKFVRHTFLTTVVQSNTHWLDRPVVPNGLRGAREGES